MSDLISKKVLLNAFNNTGVQTTFELPIEELLGEDVDIDVFTILVQDAIQAYKKMVIDTITNQPTAYDIDKVVEELETMSQYITFKDMFAVNENIKMIATDIAIEIVKQGGISDDCCEWEHSPIDNNAIRSCHHKNSMGMYKDCLSKFPYCPVCGKKIKVVERMKCDNLVYLACESTTMLDAVNKGYTHRYSKAIDDFNNSIKEELDRFEVKNLDTCILFDLMDRKAEQLKAGGENEMGIDFTR